MHFPRKFLHCKVTSKISCGNCCVVNGRDIWGGWMLLPLMKTCVRRALTITWECSVSYMVGALLVYVFLILTGIEGQFDHTGCSLYPVMSTAPQSICPLSVSMLTCTVLHSGVLRNLQTLFTLVTRVWTKHTHVSIHFYVYFVVCTGVSVVTILY